MVWCILGALVAVGLKEADSLVTVIPRMSIAQSELFNYPVPFTLPRFVICFNTAGRYVTVTIVSTRLVESFAKYGAKALKVECAASHTLILTDDGEVLSCGVGEYGRLGTGNTSDSYVAASLDFLADEDVVDIAVGHSHSLALTAEGKVYSWVRLTFIDHQVGFC
jgi:Regulator of chromosome condensation (RCC1) repeat